MKISSDFLKEIKVKKDITLQASDVQKSLELSHLVGKDKRFFVLLEGEENASVSDEARKLAASEEYAKYTRALALCSNNPAMAVMGNVFMTVSRPKIPTRFFSKREDALQWLKSLMND